MKLSRLLAVMASFAVGSLAYGQATCNYQCQGHYTQGTPYVYVEDSHQSAVSVVSTEGWKTVFRECDNGGGGVANVVSPSTFSLAVRTVMQYTVSTDAPSNARFEMQPVLVDSLGNQTVGGWYAFSIANDDGTMPTDVNQPKTEWVHGYFNSMASGSYKLRLNVRMMTTGTLYMTTTLIHAQGVPVAQSSIAQPTGSVTLSSSSWTSIADTTITNTSGAPLAAEAQNYFSITSGTAHDKIGVGFTIDGASSGTHNMNVYVSPQLPDGIHLRDHFPNEVIGTIPNDGLTHHITVYATNLSGHNNTVIDTRELTVIAFPTSLATSAYFGTSTGQTVYTAGTTPQPNGCMFQENDGFWCTGTSGCGLWTKIGSVTFPTTGGGSDFYGIGDGYIEFLGRNGTWTSGRAILGIEIVNPSLPAASDALMTEITLPNAPMAIPFWTEIARWNLSGNTVNIWIKKQQGCNQAPNEDVTFNIGKVYLGLHAITPSPLQSCYNNN